MDLVILNNVFYYLLFFKTSVFLINYFVGLTSRININSNLTILMMPQLQNSNFARWKQQILQLLLLEYQRMKILYKLSGCEFEACCSRLIEFRRIFLCKNIKTKSAEYIILASALLVINVESKKQVLLEIFFFLVDAILNTPISN